MKIVFRIHGLSHRHRQQINKIRWLILHITHSHFSRLHTITRDCNTTWIYTWRPWPRHRRSSSLATLNAFCASEVKLKRAIYDCTSQPGALGANLIVRSLSSGYLFISHPVTFRAVNARNTRNVIALVDVCVRIDFITMLSHKPNDGDRLVSNTNDSVINRRLKYKNKQFLSFPFRVFFIRFFSLFFLWKAKRRWNPSLLMIKWKTTLAPTHRMSSNRYQFY